MSRRRFIAGVVLAATPLGATASAQEYKAQPATKVWRIEYLTPAEFPPAPLIEALRQLEDENARLKRLVADLTLDKHMLSEALRKNA